LRNISLRIEAILSISPLTRTESASACATTVLISAFSAFSASRSPVTTSASGGAPSEGGGPIWSSLPAISVSRV
jgi:hypothetical protein